MNGEPGPNVAAKVAGPGSRQDRAEGWGVAVAVVRDLVIVAGVGPDACGAVDLAADEGEPIGNARCIGACIREPVGYLRRIDAGICADHERLADELGGVRVLE